MLISRESPEIYGSLKMKHGIILDLETTGLNPKEDVITELGIIEFACDDQFKNPSISKMYSGLQDPKRPLTPEIIAITGLTDELLKGRSIDWNSVNMTMSQADFIVAHNVQFDRSFLLESGNVEKEIFEKDWACSQRHIDWPTHSPGRSSALNYLAADHGFVNPFAHRALFDCATTFRLISPHVKELISRSQQKEFLVAATFAPFEKKDLLKERKYRWDGAKKVWSKVLIESDLPTEREFLAKEIYQGESKHSEMAIV